MNLTILTPNLSRRETTSAEDDSLETTKKNLLMRIEQHGDVVDGDGGVI
jgi:hypothetical protein